MFHSRGKKKKRDDDDDDDGLKKGGGLFCTPLSLVSGLGVY